MTTKRTRWLGWVLTLAISTALLVPGSALAISPTAPKTGMVCTPGTLVGTTRTFSLVAKTGTIQTPDANQVFMWSYANGDSPDLGKFQYPGPVLCATQGETLKVVLTNPGGAGGLPEATSIVFPGQEGATAIGGSAGLLTTQAPVGGSVTYTIPGANVKPGTYLYESGTNISKQVEMGLYGALVVRPNSGANYAYDTNSTTTLTPAVNSTQTTIDVASAAGFPSSGNYTIAIDSESLTVTGGQGTTTWTVSRGVNGSTAASHLNGAAVTYNATQFDPSREYMLLLSEVDPYLHHAVEIGGAYDFNALHNRYFFINGRAFPDTLQSNGSALLPTQPYGALVRLQPNDGTRTLSPLIRMLNAGVDNHPFHPHGNHTRQIAQDGRPIDSTEHFGETIGSGQTLDYLIRWDDQITGDNWNPVTNPLPVAQPSYLNLVFKDGNTWYSGNPYLGYKGTLPTGTNSLNVCGEWYFPAHSHALNEFANFDEPFGGMATLLRVDPLGGCFTFPSSTGIIGGLIKSGSVTSLGVDDTNYYQINPRTTTRTGTTTFTQTTTTLPVASATGFPTAVSGNSATYFYIRIDSEVLQVTNTAGTTWTVVRAQLGTSAPATPSHATNATITALANDWYAGFTGLPTGAQNLKVTYKGKNCSNTTGTSCTAIVAPIPQQTVKICNWTVLPTGCPTSTSAGWVTLTGTQNQPVGSTDVTTTWTAPGSPSVYIGTGAYKGQVRVLIHTDRWTVSSPTPFSTWGNLMKLVYDAP